MLIILFGLAGSGKTFVGQKLSDYSNFYFWDADEVITEAMKQCIHEKRSFTQEIRDEYFKIVIERIQLLYIQHKNIIVSQAFYKNKNREKILSEFPDCIFIQITSNFPILLDRLRKRNNSINAEYAKVISAHYEPPTHPYFIITNNVQNNPTLLINQISRIPKLSCFFTTYYQESPLKLRSGSERLGFDLKNKFQLPNITNPIQMDCSGLKLRSGSFRFFSCEKTSLFDPLRIKERNNTHGFF